jgi:hypothetical protein
MQRNKEKEHYYRQLLKLSNLDTEEFFSILNVFDQVWKHYYQRYDLQGNKRKLPKFEEHSDISLKGSHDKLLFILIYMAQNPTQQYQGVLFNMTQGKVSQWLKLLFALLRKTLARMEMLPERNADALYQSLEVLAGYFLLLDGTERPIPRPVDPDGQKYYYSGKKRMHTVKNNLISNHQQQVLYLSPTVEGKQHDKTLAQEMELHFPPEGTLLQDLGYQGFVPDNVKVIMPIKKPKKQKLSKEEKAYNKQVSSARIAVEHAIGSIKRLKIVQEKIRLRIEDIHDQVILIAVGLHNLRIGYRNLS